MQVYNQSHLAIKEESTSGVKYVVGFFVACAIVYGPMTVLFLGK